MEFHNVDIESSFFKKKKKKGYKLHTYFWQSYLYNILAKLLHYHGKEMLIIFFWVS